MNTQEVKTILDTIEKTLRLDDEQVQKRWNLYLEWLKQQTQYFVDEKQGFQVSINDLPRKISIDTYKYLYKDIKILIDKYYKLEKGMYLLKNHNVQQDDCNTLYKSLVFVKRNVVWVDFGYNIGREFGGKHPAVILKNLGEVLIVCPISSDNGKLRPQMTAVEFEPNDFYNLPSQRKRFTDITRLTPVSILRVDTRSKPGSLKMEKFTEILTKIKESYK